MRARIDAGTDIAMSGAWDAKRVGNELAQLSGKKFMVALNADAQAGHLFFIQTGADGGGPVDVFVDEEIPSKLREQVRLNEKEFLLCVESGWLKVAGVVDYRAREPSKRPNYINIPVGDYALKCHVGVMDRSEERRVGKE